MYGGEHVFKHSLAGPLLLCFFLFVLHKDSKMHRENDALRNGAPSLKMTKRKGAAGGLKLATTTKKGKEMQAGGIRINLPGLLCKGK